MVEEDAGLDCELALFLADLFRLRGSGGPEPT